MFEIELMSASFLPSAFVALVAGMLSFLSPCVLPIVPPYLAYMSGVSVQELSESQNRSRAVLTAAMFVLGLSTVFLFLGFAASYLGQVFLNNQATLNTIAGLVVMLFGLHFLRIIRIGIMDTEARFEGSQDGGSILGAYILGLAFAFGWTPCIGPQLGAILSLAAQEGSVTRGTTLLGIYALGLGVPFLLVSLFMAQLAGTMNWIKRHFDIIERIMGLMLWTIGLLMLTGGFAAMSFWLLENVPFLAAVG